jgi:hypothetical protein
MMRIPYKVYHSMFVTKLLCTCRKRIKIRRKQNKKKQNKRNKVRYKKSEKRKKNKYYNLYKNLPPQQWRQKLDTTKELMSSLKFRGVEVINNPARPGSNHREVNYINYK